jgi:hypothetical protein
VDVRFGQEQTFSRRVPMSALPLKSDIAGRQSDVRYAPILLQKDFEVGAKNVFSMMIGPFERRSAGLCGH